MKIGDLFIKLGLRKDGFDKGIDGAKAKTTSFGSAMKKIGGLIGGVFAVGALVSFGRELFNIAKQAEGVREAFSRIGTEADLENLRKSVRGTVSDLELMKRAVLAENFGIPIESLGSLLEFASKRAQDTGQSVDYLVDSIVTGIGRKSPLILDNLGISAVQLKENLDGVAIGAASVGDVAAAVGRIAEKSLNETGRLTDSLGVKVQSLGAKWDNLKLKISDLFSNSESLKKDLDDWGKLIEVWQSDSLSTWKKFWASVRRSAMDEYYDQIKAEQEADAKRQKDFQGRTLESLQKDYEIYMNNFIKETERGNNEAASHYQKMADKIKERIDELNKQKIKPDTTSIQDTIDLLRSNIGKLQNQLAGGDIVDLDQIKDATKKINEYKNSLAELLKIQASGKTTVSSLKEEITDLQQQIELSNNQETIDNLQSEIFKRQSLIDVMSEQIRKIKMLGDLESSKKTVQAFLPKRDDLKTGELSGMFGLNGLFERGKLSREASDAYDNEINRAEDFVDQLNQILNQGAVDAISSFASGIGQLAAGDIGMGEFFQIILSSIGQFLQQIGAALIAYGVSMDAFKKAFSNPFAAIAAGAALVAIGSFISSKASAGPAGGGASSYSTAGSGYKNFNASSGTAALNGNVVFELEGTKLKGVLNNTDRRNTLIR